MDSKETHRTESEQELISEIVWLYPDEALDWLDNRAEHKVDKLVQRRDAMALRYYLEHL
jgi:adenylate cyclase